MVLATLIALIHSANSAVAESVLSQAAGFHLPTIGRFHPLAEIVFDLFHVVAKYGREVIDRVRVDEANRLRDDRPARALVRSSRWLLLRNRENIPEQKGRVKPDELLAANRRLPSTDLPMVPQSSASST